MKPNPDRPPATPAALREQLRREQIARRALQREGRRMLDQAGALPAVEVRDRRRTARPGKPAPGHGKSRRTNGGHR
jgi:hypothetical protein